MWRFLLRFAAIIALTCGAIVIVGAAQAPPATSIWQRIRYPSVMIPGTRAQLGFMVNSGGHKGGPDDEPSHLRLDVQWGARDGVPLPGAIANAETVSVRLHTADGKVLTPPSSAHHWIGVGNAGSSTWSLVNIFPWSRNALDEAWFEVRAAGQTWWLELPYGFARNPEDGELPDPNHDVPRFPTTMQPLGADDILVPWLSVEYEIGRTQNGAHLSLTLSNPFDARASVVEYREPPMQVGPDTSRQKLDTPRVAVSIDAGGRRLAGHDLARRLSDDRHMRTDDFTFDRSSGVLRGRGFGTLTVNIDDQAYPLRIPSSLFLYVHGRTDPENTHWLAPAGSTAQSIPASPSASVVAHLPAGKTTYHLGEEIPLELEFRGTGDRDYFFTNARCGFFTRWGTETLTVTPSDGVQDPLAEFFGSLGGIAGSCPSSWNALDGTPLLIAMTLNDQIKFPRAGTYRLVISSTRLQRYSRQPAPVVTSAPVDLTIVPADAAWTAQELSRATQLIEDADPADSRHGAALLRYLETQAAARVLVEHYDTIAKVDRVAASAGLIVSPHRSFIIGQMEARVDEGGGWRRVFSTG